jgi:hypothetical protein
MKRFQWKWIKGIKKKINPPFFVSMAAVGQSLSNRFRFFLASLVPLDVDVVPIKFYQFLFGE